LQMKIIINSMTKTPFIYFSVYTHTIFLGLVEHKYEHYFFFNPQISREMNQDKLEFDQ